MNSDLETERVEENHRVSWYIIAYKLLLGLIEVFLAIGLIIFGHAALLWYRAYMIQELSEDPHALLVRLTEGVIPNVLTHHTFLVFYLIVLGLAKVIGAIGLMYKQDWGVDLLVGLTITMLPFQIIQLLMTPSVLDLLYISIGLFIALYLINFKPQIWVKRQIEKFKQRWR